MTEQTDALLITSETWSDYRALQLIENQLNSALAPLSDAQRLRYVHLCKIEPEARHDLAGAIQRFQNGFEETACRELVEVLREKTGQTLDLHHTWLHTRMTELPERTDAKDPVELLTRLFNRASPSRSKRALADNAPRKHVLSMTLWQAAKENFAFNLGSGLQSGLDFQRDSLLNSSAHINHSGPLANLDVGDFIAIIRRFDFAERLRSALASHLATTLDPLILAHRKSAFELDLLEAIRSNTLTGQARLDSARLLEAMASETGLSWKFFHMQVGVTLLGQADTLALPFCVMKLPASEGVFSYFPDRPEGALRHHPTVAQAIKSLREQMCAEAQANRIEWLLRNLSLADQALLLGELKTSPPDQSQLNWLARQLYAAFGDPGSPASRIHVQAEPDSARSTRHSLLKAMEMRQSRTLSQDLLSIATSTASKDLQQVINVLRQIGSEILELLTLPAPGGVTGLNKLMLSATLGTLAYNTVSGVEALTRGQSADFAQAVADIADLVISGRIQMVGARLSARRTGQLIKALGKPRAVELANGESTLWRADLHPYTPIDPQRLNGLSANAQGLYEVNGRTYALVDVEGQPRVGELGYDPTLRQYRLQHPDPGHYQPVLAHDPVRGHWRLAPVDVSQLTRGELLQTMLHPDLPVLSHADIDYLLRATQIERTRLEALWNGETRIPWTLAQAIGDLQLRRGLEQHQADLHPSPLAQGSASTRALRQRFGQLSEAAARELVQQFTSLENISRHAPLPPVQLGAIHAMQTHSRLLKAFDALHDPTGDNLGPDSEALFCNLLTTQSGWPDDLSIEVYQGALNPSGNLVKSGTLLVTYGNDSASQRVILARLDNRYAGYDQTNDDMLQPFATDYPLASMLLRTLTDRQRSSLNYQIHDGQHLAQNIFNDACIHSASLTDLLPAPTTFDLSLGRLEAFMLPFDLDRTVSADGNGLYAHDGKLYVQIEDEFFQVLHDLDASGPARQVMRIVRPNDPVADDARNHYVATRPGRSEPITRDAQGVWVGVVSGLSAGAPKVDRLKALREKSQGEYQQFIVAQSRFATIKEQVNSHFDQGASMTVFLMAGEGYYKLKVMNHSNLGTQVLRHQEIAATDFSALPAAIAQKRETLARTIGELGTIAHNYSSISDIYNTVSELEFAAMKDTTEILEGAEQDFPHYQSMQEANQRIIGLLEQLRTLAHDEMDRLLVKLDEFPPAAEPTTRAKPVPGKKKTPEKAPAKPPQPTPAAKNRVEIRTDDGKTLSGKPRTDNPHIVDILDSRGQRTATYLRSSDGQYWVMHTPAMAASTSTPSSATPRPAWATYAAATEKLFDDVRHSESVADYLRRKKDATPSAPQALLEYQANRLEESAREIHSITEQLANAEERQQAQGKITRMREMARALRQKGQAIRVDLIISNNTPNAHDLQFLADTDNLQLHKPREQRIAMQRAGTGRQQPSLDYIDEYELRIKDRDYLWAYAHLHYAEPASDGLAFIAAHLKRPEQRFHGAQLQIQEAQAGRRYEIHRGALQKAQVRDILLSHRFAPEPMQADAPPGPGGAAPKADRLRAIREKNQAEQAQRNAILTDFRDTFSDFAIHATNTATGFFYKDAGADYIELKRENHRHLSLQLEQHKRIIATDFSKLPANMPQKREALIKAIREMDNIAQQYGTIIDVYMSTCDLEVNTLLEATMTPSLKKEEERFIAMLRATGKLIAVVDRFKNIAHDEVDRLLVKLDEFPQAAPHTRIKSTPAKKNRPPELVPTGSRAPAPVAAPKNRVEIRTEEGKVLSGKPRSDNPDIVDILDSRGQRQATYLRASSGEYWLKHQKTEEPAAASTATDPIWTTYEAAAQKLLGEARHSESVADYLGRKKDATPSAPQGLLDYQANRLDEHAREIQEAFASDHRQAQDSAARLREKARLLRDKGRSLRIDLIIANNRPTALDLQHLADTDNLRVRKTHPERIAMERVGFSDFIDEFELTIRDRNHLWAYAHLHYAEQAGDGMAFSAAHLKRPEQRLQGAQRQRQEALAGRRYEIHRGALHDAQVRDILLSEHL